MKNINWAVLGTGVIANEMAVALKKNGKNIYAVGNRTHEKAVIFAEKYGIGKVYADYNEMFTDPDVDVIYITTPHNTHLNFMKKAIENGKHILVEKSITLNSDELNEALALAEEKGVIVGEAMMIFHMPIYKKLRKILESGALGKVNLITMNFGSFKEYNMGNRFFNRNLAGGAMLDIGVYALSFIRWFMDSKPDQLLSQVKQAPTKVDEQAGLLLTNAEGQMATVMLSLHSKQPKRGMVSCEKGYIEVMEYPRAWEAKITYTDSGKTELIKAGENADAPAYELADMEKEGIRVNAEALKEYGSQLEVKIKALESQIYEEAGEEFNINSPKQLGVILFEKLQLPGGKKTKTGYSTAADVLEKLAPEHKLVADILEYRQLAKLKSTYADGLAGFIGEDGRIHSTFNQTITATGRISSTEPNLQNIPIRMELGRLIRKVFIPEDGFVFVDADYSQIELRVLAHLSGDENLIEAYKEAQDIHRMTASQVFHVPFEEVTDLQRRNAKAVNFGIVYGISSFGLSQDLSITRKEAAEYIENYFATYPKIKGFLDGLVTEAKEQGYVETMFQRRRPVPEIRSGNFMQRSFGERVAMNSPIQGTAADIIKIAMIRVEQALKEQNLESRLILQVHDELLIEAKEDEVEAVKAILEREMKGAANLAVPLEIDMHTGTNWYEAK